MASRPTLEAATAEEARDLAVAAYGPHARVDVRETRKGGVLGFFAQQRFVAEVLDHADTTTMTASTNATGTGTGTGTGTATSAGVDVDGLGLDAAINEAAAMLGTPAPMADPAPIADPAPAPVVEPMAFARRDPAGFAAAVAAPAKTSSFADALARMTTDPDVDEAVAHTMDATGTALVTAPAVAAPVASVDDAVAERVVLYSVPDPVTSAAPSTTTAATPVATVDPAQINYAAGLLAARGVVAHSPAVQSPAVPVEQPVPPAPVAPATMPVAEPMTPTAPAADAVAAPAPEPVTAMTTALAAALPAAQDPARILPRLAAIGFPTDTVPGLFLHEVGEKGIHTALTRLLKMRTAPAPNLPVAPCTVVLIGPGTEALTAAMNACGALRADASQVGWVGPAHLSGLVPPSRRIASAEAAQAWLAAPKRAAVVNVIAVHSPVSENIDDHTRAVLAALDPTMVLAVVDATRKSESVARWVEALDCVDAIALENATETHDPATWLAWEAAPVALVEGRKATAARWASLLCERLTDLADFED